MKQPIRYGFVGTSGLVIMLAAGTFACAYSGFIVYKFHGGYTLELAAPHFVVLFLGGALPYLAGWMLFSWGKKIRVRQNKLGAPR